MAKQLMFYDNVVPVSPERHKDLSVESGVPYHFAKEVRAVPLVAEEIPHAAREYAVVFAVTNQETNAVTPFAILGVKDNQNLYVNDEGDWNAKYIPAFVRRYPFVFSKVPQDETRLMLCIDEEWQGCNREGRGERLFDDEGNKTPFLDRLLKFNEEFQRSSQRTELFCKQLQSLDLLAPQEARMSPGNGTGDITLRGLLNVNREKLKTLSGEKLQELVQSGALELIYSHLSSLASMATLMSNLVSQGAESGTKSGTESEGAEAK